MDYKINFTFTDDNGKVIHSKTNVTVIESNNKKEAEAKLQTLMTQSHNCIGSLFINSIEELTTDDILMNEDDVHVVTKSGAKPFFDSPQPRFNYTTTDFMNTKSFSRVLNSI